MLRACRALLLVLHGARAATIALVTVWLGPKPLPRYARATCASLKFNAEATLVLIVDDKASVPRECLDHARVWAVGDGGVARGLGEAAVRGLRLDPHHSKIVSERVVAALRRMPSLVIELKPLWVYAWRARLVRAGFERATFADLDAVWGDVKPWADASAGYDAATWSFAEGEAPARLFARGQWLLLKLDDDAAQLRWLRCAHLSTALLRNLDLKARGGRLSPGERSFDAAGGCPTVYPERPADRYVSAEACYSCAFFAPVAGDEAAEFAARFRGLAGSRGYSAAEAAALLRPLSIIVLPAVLSDHGLGRVWWTEGRVFRCATLAGPRCAAAVADHAKGPRRVIGLAPEGAPLRVERPCVSRKMDWLAESCPRSAACARLPDDRRLYAVVANGSSVAARAVVGAPTEVSEAAFFHYRIWSDRRDGLGGTFRDDVPALNRTLAVDEDGFLDAKAGAGFAADVLAGRVWDGAAVHCPGVALGDRAPLVVLQTDSERVARALARHPDVVFAEAALAFHHKSLDGRRLRAVKRAKFHFDAEGEAFETLSQLACLVAKKAGAARAGRVVGFLAPDEDAPHQRKWMKTFALESTVRVVRVATRAVDGGEDALELGRSDFAADGTSAKLERFLGLSRPREAYATLMYGDGPFACGAAVLGRALRDADPARPRVCVVWNVSEATRSILRSTWSLFDGPSVTKVRYGASGALKVKDGVPANRKAGLWLLPYDRVLFLDVDDVPFPTARLDLLWNKYGDSERLAAVPFEREGLTQRCFNSGLMLLRPSAKAYASYTEEALRLHRHQRGLCPGHDQPALNRAFHDWRAISSKDWSTATPGRAKRRCSSTLADLSREFDAYHFFLDSVPWCADTSAGCAPGLADACPSQTGICTAHAAATRAWWDMLERLPAPARGACRARLSGRPPACTLN